MPKTRVLIAATLSVLLIGTTTVATVAQDESTTPEAIHWDLTEYAVDGSLVGVPGDVRATLLLEAGDASGSGGCNTFFGSYTLDGSTISFGDAFGQTQVFCGGDAQTVEDAYLSILPTTTSWSIEGDVLRLQDASEAPVLVFGSSTAGTPTVTDRILALLEALQAELGAMDARITQLEGGGSSATDGGTGNGGGQQQAARKPRPPAARGGGVQTVFPDWMRDEFRPEAERSDEKNREIVRWRARSNDADGFRIYARRGFCALKSGANPNQELSEDDFRRSRSAAQQIAQVGVKTKRYRPDHAAIDAALPAAPESPYSNDQFYDVLVSSFNEQGESKKVLVGSFYLTPEFNCP